MGTWGAPHTKEQKAELRKKLKELKQVQQEIGAIFGDDILQDAFDNAVDRVKYALKGDWGPAPELED